MILTSAVLLRNRFEFKSITEQQNVQETKDIKVSICVPARNEEDVIERCIRSLVNQNYKNLEILVLDDNSEDKTSEILKHLEAGFQNLKIISGSPKPKDWLGKPWACHQLSKKATGDILVFIDADVWLESNVILKSVSKLKNFDAITIWPQQIVIGLLEKLIVPAVYFSLLTLLPAVYVERSPRWMPHTMRSYFNKKFVAACGQFIAFNKQAYDAINGHEGVKTQVVEDMELARNLKNHSFSLSMANGIDSVYCRMYTSSSEIWQGFQKNFLSGFGNVFEFLIMAILHLLFFLFPIYSLIVGLINDQLLVTILSVGIIILYICQRLILNLWFKCNWWMAFFHPLSVLWFQALGLKCIINRIFGLKSTWKGRQI